MCGIVGYIGNSQAYPILINGLKRLEYRGYDSAGISILNSTTKTFKCKGKVNDLEAHINGESVTGSIGIGHTRWATHGEPNDINAHPHTSQKGHFILIHNGIIENYSGLRSELQKKGYKFKSQTDTEVLVNLIEHIYLTAKVSSEVAVQLALHKVVGAYGLVIICVDEPDQLIAARKGKKAVNKQDFLDAVDRIIGGLEKKNKIVTPAEKRAVAFHEAGHATVSWMLEHAAPLVKVTIVPRGRSLGAAWYLPEERLIVHPEQMLDEMCAALGGRAAEKVIFDKISTGALSDLEKVTKQARAMVTIYGLSEKVGNLTYYDSSGQSEYGFTKPYSEKTAELIDNEVKKAVHKSVEKFESLGWEIEEAIIKGVDPSRAFSAIWLVTFGYDRLRRYP